MSNQKSTSKRNDNATYESGFGRPCPTRPAYLPTMSVHVVLHVNAEVRAVVDCLCYRFEAVMRSFVEHGRRKV